SFHWRPVLRPNQFRYDAHQSAGAESAESVSGTEQRTHHLVGCTDWQAGQRSVHRALGPVADAGAERGSQVHFSDANRVEELQSIRILRPAASPRIPDPGQVTNK